MSRFFNALTRKQMERLPNWKPFSINYPGYELVTFKAEGARRWFYVAPIEATDAHDYVYSTDNIDNLNGWLYGAVQAMYTLKGRVKL